MSVEWWSVEWWVMRVVMTRDEVERFPMAALAERTANPDLKYVNDELVEPVDYFPSQESATERMLDLARQPGSRYKVVLNVDLTTAA